MPILLRAAFLDALAVLAPVECAGCGAPDRGLCAACRAAFAPDLSAHPLNDGSVVWAAVRYESAVRETILAFKEQGRTDVASTLGGSLAAALAHVAQPGIEVAAVPTSAAARRRRGYDPVGVLCRKAGFRPVRVLRQSRAVRSQKTLGQGERAANLDHSLVASRSLAGRRFILVDDVVTTGATLVEARRAIVAAGGEVVAAAALAFTPRLFANSKPI